MDTLPPQATTPAERLDSWKEIARYLNRDESTVQRWEKREGMPVHRHLHDKRGSVYAYRAELDAWWQGRRQQLEPGRAGGAETSPGFTTVVPPGAAGPEPRRWRRWWLGAVAAVVLIAAGLFALNWRSGSGRPAPNPAPKIVRLTSTSGVNIDPALSPDGSLLAYASDRQGSGELDIWVQPIGKESPTRVTSDAGDELEPSFSPAGESIVFVKGEAGGIYLVGATGGESRPLVTAARARTPRFSPDGRWVTYWTGLPVWVIPTAPGATGALFVVPVTGGSPVAIAPQFAHSRYGTWAPDGERILFVGERQRDADQSSLDWYVAGVNGGEPIRTGVLEVLRGAGVKGVPIPAAWSANGAVIFATNDAGASNVWQVAVSPATGRVIGQPVRLTLGTAIERSPAATSDGRVVFTSVVENVDIWRLPLDTKTGFVSGAIERVTDNAANDRLINVSDDGRTMAFVSSRAGQNEVWIRDLHTNRERQIAYPNARAGRVSHDGSLLAIDKGAAENRGVDLVPAAGGTASPFCEGCEVGDWAPDGSRMAVHRGEPSRLLVRSLGSGREVELAAHPAWNIFRPRFSPDGKWIAFHTTNSPSLRQIHAVPVNSDGPIPVAAWITVVPDFGVMPSWAPDGAGLYYFSLRDGAFCAWLQPVEPATKRPVGDPRAIQHFHQPRLRAGTAAASTNHRAPGYWYVTLTSSAANIWMLER